MSAPTRQVAGAAALCAAGAGLTIAAVGAAEISMRPEGDERAEIALLFAGIAAVAFLAALVAAWAVRNARTVNRSMLFLTLTPVASTTAAVFAAAQLMYVSTHDRDLVLIVLGFTLALSVTFAQIIARPLVHDLRRLERVADDVRQGDLSVRSFVHREDELGSMATTFDSMLDELARLRNEREEMESERQQLLAAMGHDLRTPVSAMRAGVEALRDGMAPDPDRYLRALEANLNDLSRLIDDLFLFARIDAGAYEPMLDRIDVAEIVDDAVEALSPTAARVGVDLIRRFDAAAPIDGDATDVSRAVRNLIDNAIRHANERVVATVTTTGSENGREVRVEIVDDGEGFLPGFREFAFEPFARSDNARSRTHGGAGLGLAIVAGVAEAHGGSATLGCGPGGNVMLCFPAATADSAVIGS